MNNYSSSVVALSTTEATVIARNDNRTALILSNQSAVAMHIYTETNSTEYIVIAAGGTFEFQNPPSNELRGVTASSTGNLAVWEA